MFVDTIDQSVAEIILDHLQASTGSMAVAQLRPWVGRWLECLWTPPRLPIASHGSW